MNRTATSLTIGFFLTLMCFGSGYAQEEVPDLTATVAAAQGHAQVLPAEGQSHTVPRTGTVINLWDTVTTDSNSKIALQLRKGLMEFLGGSSSAYLSSDKAEGGPRLNVEIIRGVFRFTDVPETGTYRTPFYEVTTPLASIYPVAYRKPVDFTVEAYGPHTIMVSVIDGAVRVLRKDGTGEIVRSCHNLFLEKGKRAVASLPLSAANLATLERATTIHGTVSADLGTCRVPASAESAPATSLSTPLAAGAARAGTKLMSRYLMIHTDALLHG
jgi:hypothetical protein